MRCYCVFFFFLVFFIKAYVVGTHLNCNDKSVQFKSVPTTCAFIKNCTKYTGCNAKTMELLDCALIGVCAVIKSNAVFEECRNVTATTNMIVLIRSPR